LLLVLLSIFYAGSRRTILLASRQVMSQASRRINERLDGHLGEAERVVASLESQAALGRIDSGRPETIETALIGELTGHPRLTEVTFTYGHAVAFYEHDEGEHDAGDLRLAPQGSGQITASRLAGDTLDILVRRISQVAGHWSAEERQLPGDASPHTAAAPPTDPTLHATFTVPSREEHRGRALWSDLSYAEADGGLPETDRRRVVSVQQALRSRDEAFLGVARVTLQSDRIDELARVRVDESSQADEHLVFLCDRLGRLISRLGQADRFALLDSEGKPDPDGDVRVVPASMPPQVAAALRAPIMQDVAAGGSTVVRLDVGGVAYLMSVTGLLEGRTQGWRVGIVVPEAHYLGALEASRRRVLGIAAALMLAAMIGAALVLRALRADLGRLIRETTRLRGFDFSPSPSERGSFRDVHAAAESLEQAKTALRSLGKYVPLDLVRQLYDARLEPTLGAEIHDVTLLFSDIEGFTSLSEQLSPNALAVALGAYLEAMTKAIHATGGIIDKYTGDGVMALWNTPRPCERHAMRACEAALACRDATQALFATPQWDGRAPWRTRYGIHRAEVSVGHFGAPDRMSFTAMGDGVNLASRLESLSKQYGTEILVSAAIEREARDSFRFRRLDRVAVKGKREGLEIFELTGRRDGPAPPFIGRYEKALEAYFARRFDLALELLGSGADDPPSQVLARRCRRFYTEPPPADWDGVYVASDK
jgi:adenylate cyclase